MPYFNAEKSVGFRNTENRRIGQQLCRSPPKHPLPSPTRDRPGNPSRISSPLPAGVREQIDERLAGTFGLIQRACRAHSSLPCRLKELHRVVAEARVEPVELSLVRRVGYF